MHPNPKPFTLKPVPAPSHIYTNTAASTGILLLSSFQHILCSSQWTVQLCSRRMASRQFCLWCEPGVPVPNASSCAARFINPVVEFSFAFPSGVTLFLFLCARRVLRLVPECADHDGAHCASQRVPGVCGGLLRVARACGLQPLLPWPGCIHQVGSRMPLILCSHVLDSACH